jgi:hypothetical protein
MAHKFDFAENAEFRHCTAWQKENSAFESLL